MSKESAGLLLYRFVDGAPEVLLVHPGGPFWKRRDDGAWSIPKGEIEAGETREGVARREFAEELGQPAPDVELTPLGSVRQAGGKVVHAWAARGDLDVSQVNSVTFAVEWPPKSGRMQDFPEVDRAAWLGIAEARRKILPAQSAFIDRLEAVLPTHGP
ncbi:MAG: NUDIX domain-containing protein [Chloroflexi bacterium]|nr:MAG: NUDIX domain-containing protein [Chloroflexota bacterium]TME43136.1 MAG: NUDIX domain-containing protein [Chloroflexota bacterium]TME51725.1 MAG: NUDIX domain-containing protein [Chloroflexota bacterium]